MSDADSRLERAVTPLRLLNYLAIYAHTSGFRVLPSVDGHRLLYRQLILPSGDPAVLNFLLLFTDQTSHAVGNELLYYVIMCDTEHRFPFLDPPIEGSRINLHDNVNGVELTPDVNFAPLTVQCRELIYSALLSTNMNHRRDFLW